MKKSSSVVSVATKKTENVMDKPVKVVNKKDKLPKLVFKAVEEAELKQKDKAFVSLVIGQFALAHSVKFELPLAVTRLDDGRACPAFQFDNVERAFYVLHKKMLGCVKLSLVKKDCQEGSQWAVVIERTEKRQALKTVAPSATDKKVLSSAKRVKRAADNKKEKKDKAVEKQLSKVAELKETLDKQALLAETQKEKRAKALSQGDGKKANQLLAQETACAHLALRAKIEIAIREAAPELPDAVIANILEKVYSAVKD